MASDAVCFNHVDCRGTDTAQNVFAGSDLLNVVRVDALAVAAQMIAWKILVERSNEQAVGHSMRRVNASIDSDFAVAAGT